MLTKSLGNPELHFWLTRSVAKVMGINLSEAIAQGRISPQDYASMVTACRQCSNVESCQIWLGKQKSLTRIAPDRCANAKTLQALAIKH
jgi:hypothetical protein